MKTTVIGTIGLLTIGAGLLHAQEPPPPTPPAVQEQEQRPAVETAKPAPAPLTDGELRRRRESIFLMEGLLVNAVRMGAGRTAAQIERFQPGLRMFTTAQPQARGSHLEDYGVFFQVEIPTVMPSVVDIVETLARRQMLPPPSPAQPTAITPPLPADTMAVLMDPDAAYVEEIKTVLIDSMLDYSKSLELRPHEWLTVSARGEPGQLSQPSIMILRVRGADLIDFLAGRLTREQVKARVQLQGFSGR